MEYEVGDDESLSTAVVNAVSAVDGRTPESLPLLCRVVDPDALDRLFAPSFTGEPRSGGRLRFIYDYCYVTIDDGEYLTVKPLENHPRLSGDRPDDGDEVS
jgi:hypothetical protein